jgi:hypothetical protein
MDSDQKSCDSKAVAKSKKYPQDPKIRAIFGFLCESPTKGFAIKAVGFLPGAVTVDIAKSKSSNSEWSSC